MYDKEKQGYDTMLNSLSEHIADFLFRQKCFDEEMLPVYIYGTKVFLSSLFGVILVITTGIIFGEFVSGLLFLFSFIGLRLFTGGLHCNSYTACNVTTVVTFVIAVLLSKVITTISFNHYILFAMMITTVTIVSLLAPVSHPNKEIVQKDRLKFRLISIGILLLHTVIIIFLNNILNTEIIVITDFISSIYIILGLIKNKNERSKNYETQTDNS